MTRRARLGAFLRGLRSPRTLFAPAANTARYFVDCTKCRRVVPVWQYFERNTKNLPNGCKCGGLSFNPVSVSTAREIWLVLFVGFLWRGLVLNKKHIDPRLLRENEPVAV